MSDKKVLINTNDLSFLEDTIKLIERNFSNLSFNISRMRIEGNNNYIALSFKGETEDIYKAVSLLKQTPSIKLEEI